MPGVYSDDSDIYSAAQQAGVLNPGDTGDAGTSGTDADGDNDGDTAPIGDAGVSGPITNPSQVETTDQFIHRMTGGNVNPATLPAAQAPSSSTSVSGSYHGFNADKYKQVSGTQGDLNKDLANAEAQGEAERKQESGIFEGYRRESTDAAKAVGTAAGNLELAKGHQATLLENINNNFAAEEAKINEHYRAESNQAKADYMAALQDFKASGVNPDQLWERGGTKGQLATMAAVFMHDFLGARGIQTSAMDTINRSIDRNMQAQEAEIRKKGQVAEGYKTLWDMQRSQSASDAEARIRVRGFLLDSVKQQVTSHMASYESALATAQGQAAVAKIDEEFSKNLVDLYHHVDTVTIARKNQAIQIWSDKLKNAQESWANSLKQQEINAKNKVPNPLEDLIINPITKRPMGTYQPGIRPEEKQAYRTKLASLSDTSNDLRQMMDIVRRNPGRMDLFSDTRFADADGQTFDFLRKKVAQSMSKATDGRVAEYEVNGFLQGMRPDTLANRAEAEKVLAATSNSWLQQGTSEFAQLGQSLPSDDPRRELSMYNEEPFGPIIRENKDIQNPPEKTTGEKYVDEITQNLGRPDAARPINPTVRNNDEVFKQNPGLKKDHAQLLKEAGEDNLGGYNPSEAKEPLVRGYEVELSKLRRLAEQGGATGDKALKQLQAAALPAFDPSGIQTSPEAIFALIQLHDLTTQEDWIAREKSDTEIPVSPDTYEPQTQRVELGK